MNMEDSAGQTIFDQVKIYDDFFSVSDFAKIINKLSESNWKWYQHVKKGQPHKFWQMDLLKDPLFNHDLMVTINKHLEKPGKLFTIYGNGQTFAQESLWHVDLPESYNGVEAYTILLYAHPEWDDLWGGRTFFKDEENDKILTVEPVPNRCVIFPWYIPHYGEAPTRSTYELRQTVAWKVIIDKTDGMGYTKRIPLNLNESSN